MNNINKQEIKTEPVEVMALFTYGLNPCEPLRFKRVGRPELAVTSLIRAQVRFVGATAQHIFDVVAGRHNYRLAFDSETLHWSLSEI
jgi:hypothetical protein